MRKAIAMLGLALMVVGISLTAFGTQQTTEVNNSCSSVYWSCVGDITTQPNFTINYVGMFLGVLGSVFFAVSYPKRQSISLPINALSLNF
jgi:hypothetical protein